MVCWRSYNREVLHSLRHVRSIFHNTVDHHTQWYKLQIVCSPSYYIFLVGWHWHVCIIILWARSRKMEKVCRIIQPEKDRRENCKEDRRSQKWASYIWPEEIKAKQRHYQRRLWQLGLVDRNKLWRWYLVLIFTPTREERCSFCFRMVIIYS